MGIRDFSKTKLIQLEEQFEKHFAVPDNTHVSILREFEIKYSRRIGNIKNRELVQNYNPYRTISIKYEVFDKYKNFLFDKIYKHKTYKSLFYTHLFNYLFVYNNFYLYNFINLFFKTSSKNLKNFFFFNLI